MIERLLVLLASLVVLSAVFAVVERKWPSVRGQRRFRKGLLTDLAYFAFTPTIGRLFGNVVLIFVIAIVAAVFLGMRPSDLRDYAGRDTFFSRQPLGLQAIELIVMGDFLGYWSHRAFHTFERLWRIHAIHHSSTELDWLSSVRVHPLNDALQNVIVVTPLFLLGFAPGAVAAYVPLLTLYAIMLHANVAWSFGPLLYVLASPTFHRWHHSDERLALNKNFAGLLPVWDLLFGTFYLPKGVRPVSFGVRGGSVPSSFLPQLLYPLRRRRPRSRAVAVA